MTNHMPSLQDIVATLHMERHHLAGWYAPHFFDGETWGTPKFSSMYYLLAADEPFPLHKLEGIEVWHYYLGAPAEFTVTNGARARGRMREVSLLGTDLASGQRPQLAVPAHFCHSCRSLGDWTLLGCTMSPGYAPRSPFILSAID